MPTLTACVVTRNAAKSIGRWLCCAKAIADERIVVDIGSRDKTPEIARRVDGQARVLAFDARGDLASARNYAVGEAKGDWVLFTEPEEYFGCEAIDALRQSLTQMAETGEHDGMAFPRLFLDDQGNAHEKGREIAVFRRDPAHGYAGEERPRLVPRPGKKLRGMREVFLYRARPQRIRLSACVIARDEERNMGRWLAGMQEVADEMIVVDTGSVDRTAAIAREHGAKVFSFPWRDDFSAAKNYALDRAKGDWVLFPDADEFFTAGSLPRIRPLVAWLHPQREIRQVECRLVNVDEDAGNAFRDAFMQRRIFRRDANLRYAGTVHEHLEDTGEGLVYGTREIEIHHTGYSGSRIAQKMRRNLALLQEKAAREGRENPADFRYFMECYYGLEDYDRSIAYAREVLGRESERRFHGRAYEVWISALLGDGKKEKEILPLMDAASAAFPREGKFLLMKGIYLGGAGKDGAARKWLKRGLALGPDGRGSVADDWERYEREARRMLKKIARRAKAAGEGE